MHLAFNDTNKRDSHTPQDTCKFILDGWHKQYGEGLFKTPKVLTALVDAGYLGNKSDKGGFYVKGKPNKELKNILKSIH